MEDKKVIKSVQTDDTGGAAYLLQNRNASRYSVLLYNKETGYKMEVHSGASFTDALIRFHEFVRCVKQPI